MIDLVKPNGFALHVDHNAKRQIGVCRNLQSLGLEPHRAQSLSDAKDLASRNSYRLILMQLETMGKEIFPFCAHLRDSDPHAVLIALMKKFRVSVEERLFECGINDVVTAQHTSAGVLTKRIRAHLINSAALLHPRLVRIAEAEIDFDRREVRRCGTTYPLPGILSDLLRYFVANANRVISRDELKISSIWAESICLSPNEGGKTWDVYVGKLRKILDPDHLHPEIITSVRGIGWKLTTDTAQ